ncbi:MAG: PSD1 and planctomycete cytochrome C domain-containing protein [Armatimonadota bacterium]
MKRSAVKLGSRAGTVRAGVVLALSAALAFLASPAAAAPARADMLKFFESRVRPVLAQKCGACHGPRLQQGKLRVDSREALLRGGARGTALVPGKPDASPLIAAVRHSDPGLKMPPGGRLSDREIADLTLWVERGAPWPAAVAPSGDDHWSFRPPRRGAVPALPGRTFRNPIDAFLEAKRAEKGLKPAPPADRRTLIRRATFDLTGLPPTPEEIRAFLADRSPNAFEKVVDRLLASPRYGERWGRHWLDVVRYADSNGLDENYHYANAYRYRDYVIEAFNRDLPYDQFLREQLAGDLLPVANDPAESRRRLIATGFLLLGPKLLANPDKEQVLADITDEQIDATSRSMLGLTLACARCHDHKFDPLSQRDYYALAGIFRSTRTMVHLKDRIWSERPLASQAEVERFAAHQAALEAKRKALAEAKKKNGGGEEAARLEAEVAELERTAPPPIPYALAVSDGQAEDAQLFIRGDHNQPSERVPRGFPARLAGGPQPQLDATRSGRLELAAWLTRPDHPLTARVMVNRVWQGHFGEGLVRTPDNFGRLGELPSHPELLDYLASVFAAPATANPGTERQSEGETERVRTAAFGGRSAPAARKGSRFIPHPSSFIPQRGLGWSLKRLHRLIMLSDAYQMSTAFEAKAHQVDPDNRLLWRMHRRRLSAEEQRDAMLRIGERLDLTMGGSILAVPNRERVTNDGSTDLAAGVYDSPRRTIYLPVVRNSLFEMLELFDFVDPSVVTARRSETIASPQALFMLNHPLMRKAAADFAARLLRTEGRSDAERVSEAYLLAFGRPATARETTAALAYLEEYAGALAGGDDRRTQAWQSLCHALFCANEFLYVD